MVQVAPASTQSTLRLRLPAPESESAPVASYVLAPPRSTVTTCQVQLGRANRLIPKAVVWNGTSPQEHSLGMHTDRHDRIPDTVTDGQFSAGNKPPNITILVKKLQIAASNVCVGITGTKTCVKTTFSM